ncbi:MAG: helix-hairpin-helix domain-containing protein [Cellulophaga sp.]|nr:helix-hairpin-helix domain-containing protein [Cellulophaga sp.]
MKNFISHFKFNKQERSGIFFLLLFIVLLQIGYFYYKSKVFNTKDVFVLNEKQQKSIQLLKVEKQKKDSLYLFPFNPNFINDAKGYKLGMSLEEIDRLHQFRTTGKYVNSDEEFQNITLVSDSLLAIIAPYFKFPEWVTTASKSAKQFTNNKASKFVEKEISIIKQDINLATASDLKKISGIGDKLSERIIKFRDKLGGFLVDEQLFDVYGLAPEVAKKALYNFTVIEKPTIVKINLNTCTAADLSQLVYINYALSKRIINYRNAEYGIKTFEELTKIEGFPAEKINRISLYLSL